jgi:hypothetical protein
MERLWVALPEFHVNAFSWVKRRPLGILFTSWGPSQRRRTYRRERINRHFRPLVEQLEDRLNPSAVLSIKPITWDIIGLDSNNVAAGRPAIWSALA